MENDNKLSDKDLFTVKQVLEGSKHIKVCSVVSGLSYDVKSVLRNAYDSRKYLTVAEAAIWLDKHVQTIYKYVKEDKLVVRRAGPLGDIEIDVEASRPLLLNK